MMRFLSPELVVRINDAVGQEADALYEQWEAMGQAERAYYAEVKDRMPPKLAEFVDTMCLHDAAWMGLTFSASHDGSRLAVAAINIRQEDDIITLVYDLYEEPQWLAPAPESRIWSEQQVTWLYDEIGLLNDTAFTHEILLSNGKVLKLVFFHFSFSISRSLSSIPRSTVWAG